MDYQFYRVGVLLHQVFVSEIVSPSPRCQGKSPTTPRMRTDSEIYRFGVFQYFLFLIYHILFSLVPRCSFCVYIFLDYIFKNVFVLPFALFRPLSFLIVFEVLTSHCNVYNLLCVFICVLRFFSCFCFCSEQTQNKGQKTQQNEFENEPI